MTRESGPKMLLFYIVLAGVFSLLAALSAFIITYGEYLKHYPDKKRPLKIALNMALATFAFFMILTILMTGLMSLF